MYEYDDVIVVFVPRRAHTPRVSICKQRKLEVKKELGLQLVMQETRKQRIYLSSYPYIKLIQTQSTSR